MNTSNYYQFDIDHMFITHFSFLSSNIPSSPAYSVFISQFIWYARACTSYECFILRAARLSCKLLGQGYDREHFFNHPSWSSMVDMWIINSPSSKCYMTFWDMIIYSDILHWLDISLNSDLVTVHDLITVSGVITYIHNSGKFLQNI